MGIKGLSAKFAKYGTMLAVLALLLPLHNASAQTAASYEASWDRIKRKGTVTTGCLVQLPYWYKDKDTSEWKGWGITAGKKLAEDLKTKHTCEEVTWGTAALAIQSDKVDVMWALQATPLRATVITFAGPLYNHGFMTVNRKGFKAQTWEDYNKPEIKIAVQGGTSSSLRIHELAPKAQIVEFQQASQLALSVVAGHADALAISLINGVVFKARNQEIGDLVIPTPVLSFPAYAGVKNEVDHRFSDFMHWWAEWYRLQGDVEKWVRASLVEMGVKDEDLPDQLHF